MYHIFHTCKKSSTLLLLTPKRVFTSSCHAEKSSKSCKAAKPSMVTLDFWSDKTTWQRTRINTLRCLVGCTAGDFSTMWYLQSAYPSMPALTCTAMSMVAGITTSLALETVLLQRSMKVPYTAAFKTAMGMSFVSMLAMETAENVVDWHLTGGQVMLQDPKFWLAAAASAAAGYIVPLPYNYWRLRALGKACH
ncbi:hypothetical protein K450DRAFT_262451 [Umbelopsis ramanniana AG]|uniref:DUF4396 domain-containing protein n=1 Tax=Umbelopsis ramanniana AG TaxID=1314678 RepID=A0AAD5E2J6_UMBRA|nr:uncharacterized protein K450DRAFT_262451 [Umbelopsis ramanniana AG]KAI8575291.1 hypothetical protein K450DRAFT_262451 [Umbelopsis ramanniana AG]